MAGKKQGHGIFTYSNGDFYEGMYENDLKHGQGTYNHKDGNRYRGAWFAGKQHGVGTFFGNNGNRYEGAAPWCLVLNPQGSSLTPKPILTCGTDL